MEVISCKQISKHFQTGVVRRQNKHVVKKVTFQVNAEEVFGIIGPNGAGKSSLLKILMGFISPDEGMCSINSYSPGSTGANKQIGYLPENPSLYPHLTPREHLQFACRVENISEKQSKTIIAHALQTVDLTDNADIAIRRFSKGMTQRAALAYAILLKPKILILDEPMSGLDPLGRQLVIDIIRQYNDMNTTILFCSHILSDVERICNRIGIMHNGELVSIISPTQLTDADGYRQRENGGKTPLEDYFLKIVKGQES